MSVERIRQLERDLSELEKRVNSNDQRITRVETYWKVAIGELTFISTILIIVLIQVLKI